MSSATAWNVRGVGRDTRAFAEEAARRAGMTLGDWLDAVVADKAAEQGVDPADLARDERLDAIAERIAGLARRGARLGEDTAAEPRGERLREEPRRNPRESDLGREQARRAEDLLESAIARLESRAERTEAHAARAFETVAQWIERSETDRNEERAALKAVVDKLAAIDPRAARPPAPPEAPRRPDPPAGEPERDLDERMNALARRLETAQERPREAPRPPERPRIDPRDAATQIAKRRSELDARARPLEPEAPKRAWRNFGVDGASTPRQPAPLPPAVAAARSTSSAAPAPVESLREEILALAHRIEQMRREQNERSAPPGADVQALRAELAAMSRSLADLAPRNAVVALEGAMRDLSERISALRANGARDALVAPLEGLIQQLRDALRAHDPQAAVAGLQREIRAIDAKIDGISAGLIDPQAFERIRAQTEEVRNLLAAAAMRPVPVERLEKQIGDLADRVERLSSNPSPQAESARVVALLSDARAQIERSTPAAALSAIERRLEQLAQRMDQALQRPAPSVEPRAIEDLARRIDGVRATIERQSGAQPDIAKLEAALQELSRKLDRPAGTPDPDAFAAMFRDLGARIEQRAHPTLDITPLEQALRALGERPIEIDTAPIENLMRDLGAKFSAPPPVDMRPLEALLREIDHKLDRGANAATAPEEIVTLIRDLGARLDARIGAASDTRALEEALQALQDRLDRAPAKPDAALVERAADLFAERMAHREGSHVDPNALADQIADIHDRLDALQANAGSNGALERKIADLIGELDATRRTLQALPAGGGRESDDIADGLADLRAEQASADKRTQSRLAGLQDILERLVNRLGHIEDEMARVDENARANAFAAAPRVSSGGAGDAFATSGAAMRDIPDRVAARPTRETPTVAPPVRSIEGADFLLEPGAPIAPPRGPATADAPSPKSAVNAHIAAARRAAQAALEERAGKTRQAAGSGDGEADGRAHEALADQAKAFLAARRRPLLLGASLLVLIGAFATVELRGGRPALPQKSDLEAPAHVPGKAETPKVGATGAADIDTSPVGSIGAPSASTKSAKGAPSDLVAAIPNGLPQSLRDAAATGEPNAEFEMAVRLIEGRGVAKDAHAAAQWFELAAARDLPIAEYRLGALYEKGVGVARDVPLAMSWYGKAAAAGNARAMHNLAVLNAEGGAGGKPDYAEAAQWFRKAGQFGIRDSQFNLGILYARGMGVPQDLVQSWLWFSLAAQQGDADAAKKRDEVAAKMDGQALLAAAKALAAFQVATPPPAANEAATPPGGWDGKPGAPQSSQAPAPPPRAGSAVL